MGLMISLKNSAAFGIATFLITVLQHLNLDFLFLFGGCSFFTCLICWFTAFSQTQFMWSVTLALLFLYYLFSIVYFTLIHLESSLNLVLAWVALLLWLCFLLLIQY